MSNFGQAIEHIKSGKTAARDGWNGKGMYIFLHKGSHDFGQTQESIPGVEDVAQPVGGIAAELFEGGMAGTWTRLPSVAFKTAPGHILVGWLASQSDMLADDWVLLP